MLMLQVELDPDVTGPRHLIQAVEDVGFEAQVADADRSPSFPSWSGFWQHSCFYSSPRNIAEQQVS